MTVLTFPSIRLPSAVTWRLRGRTQKFESPLTGAMQTYSTPGSVWRGNLQWDRLPEDEWRTLSAFIAGLQGSAGRFTYSPPQSWRRATATVGGHAHVDGAGQIGATLATKDWPNSAIVLEVGDYVSFIGAGSTPQLYQIKARVTSNGSGHASLTLAPPLRSSPADGADIEIVAPVGVFMLADDDQGQFQHSGQRRRYASVGLDIVEALI